MGENQPWQTNAAPGTLDRPFLALDFSICEEFRNCGYGESKTKPKPQPKPKTQTITTEDTKSHGGKPQKGLGHEAS
jgi:hypothetical protein